MPPPKRAPTKPASTHASPTKGTVPTPGSAVRGSRRGRPIMVLLDLLGRRWALRIAWELRADTLSFRDLRQRCEEMSPSVLSQRLREGSAAGLIERADGGYRLTAAGRELTALMLPLDEWATRWAARSGYRDAS